MYHSLCKITPHRIQTVTNCYPRNIRRDEPWTVLCCLGKQVMNVVVPLVSSLVLSTDQIFLYGPYSIIEKLDLDTFTGKLRPNWGEPEQAPH